MKNGVQHKAGKFTPADEAAAEREITKFLLPSRQPAGRRRYKRRFGAGVAMEDSR